MAQYKAVILDFDGVVADTLEDGCRAWEQACSEYGVSFDRDEFLLAEGKRSHEYLAPVLERHGLSAEYAQEIIDRKNQIYATIHTFAFFEGIVEWIEELQHAGIKTAVVSGGSRVRLLNGASGSFLQKRNAVVTGDDVTHGKPSPEPFLSAARDLGVSPDECLVIENAPLGVRAAKAAGMTCIAVCSTLPAAVLAEADIICTSIRDVVRETQKLGVLSMPERSLSEAKPQRVL